MPDIKKGNGKKTTEKRKEIDLFTVVEEKEEHTLNKILSRKISAPVKIISESEKEAKRRSDLIVLFKEKYLNSVKLYKEKGYILDITSFNRCCSLLNESLTYPDYDRTMIDILKNIIKEIADDNLNLLYIYYMPQSVIITFIQEYYNHVEEFDSHKTLDRAYKEVFEEIKLRRKNNGKNSP